MPPPRCTALLAVLLSAVLWLCAPVVTAQPLVDPVPGPVIEGFGETYPVEALDIAPPTDQPYQLLFDISTSPDAPEAPSTQLNTVARFLNMHARAGVPMAQMQVAIVLHGTAGKYALNRDAYRARYGVEHTNLARIDALHEAGVAIYLCGQTAMHRGLPPSDLAPSVDLALSAMTMIASLGAEGYTVVSW